MMAGLYRGQMEGHYHMGLDPATVFYVSLLQRGQAHRARGVRRLMLTPGQYAGPQ
jgi:hypothetical protein